MNVSIGNQSPLTLPTDKYTLIVEERSEKIRLQNTFNNEFTSTLILSIMLVQLLNKITL